MYLLKLKKGCGMASKPSLEARKALLSFAKEMAGRRGYRRMTQGRLAELAGTTQTTISAIERGEANPSIGLLADIAAVFGMELGIKFKDWQPGQD
jgi:DNA-binding XRE family transcriptional regulator